MSGLLVCGWAEVPAVAVQVGVQRTVSAHRTRQVIGGPRPSPGDLRGPSVCERCVSGVRRLLDKRLRLAGRARLKLRLPLAAGNFEDRVRSLGSGRAVSSSACSRTRLL